MGKIRITQSSFLFGAVAPDAVGNTDFEQYNMLLSQADNVMFPAKSGLFKRPGTKFVAEAVNRNSRLIGLIFDDDSQYLLEFTTTGKIKFYGKSGLEKDKDNEDIIIPFVSLTAEQLKTISVTIDQRDHSVQVFCPFGLYKLYRGKLTGKWTVQPDVDNLYSTLLFNAAPMTIVNNNPEKRVTLLTMSIDPDTVQPDDKWQYLGMELTPPVPYGGHTVKSIYASGFWSPSSIDWLQSVFIPFRHGDEILNCWFNILKSLPVEYFPADLYVPVEEFRKSKPVTIKDDRAEGLIWLKLDESKSDKEGTEAFLTALRNRTVQQEYAFEAFNRENGYVKAFEMHDGRLYLATGSVIYGSKLLDYKDFRLGSEETDPIIGEINMAEGQNIYWLRSMEKLFFGTSYGIYIVGGSSIAGGQPQLSQGTFSSTKFSAITACEMQPINTTKSLFFVDKTRKRIYEIFVNSDVQAFEARDRTLTGDHLIKSGIVSHTWQSEPMNMYWCCCQDGTLNSFTYVDGVASVTAWARHTLGGNAKVLDVENVRYTRGDTLFLLTERIIDGETKVFIEYMSTQFNAGHDTEDKQYYVDCGKTFKGKGAKVNTITSPKDIVDFSENSEYLPRTVAAETKLLCVYTEDRDVQKIVLRVSNIYKADKKLRISLKEDIALPNTCNEYIKLGNIEGSYSSGRVVIVFMPTNDTDMFARLTGKFADNAITGLRCLNTSVDDVGLNGVKIRKSNNLIQIMLDYNQQIVLQDNAELYVSLGTLTAALKLNPMRIIFEHTVDSNRCVITGLTGTDADYFNGKTFYKLEGESFSLEGRIDYKDNTADNRVFDLQGGEIFEKIETLSLPHLIGQKISVLQDGIAKPLVVVPPDGKVPLLSPAVYVSAGLPYKTIIQTVPYFGGNMAGSSVGSEGRIHEISLHVFFSSGGKYAFDEFPDSEIFDIDYKNYEGYNPPKNVFEVSVINGEDALNASLVTGIVTINTLTRLPKNRSIILYHDAPTAFNVLSVTMSMWVKDG